MSLLFWRRTSASSAAVRLRSASRELARDGAALAVDDGSEGTELEVMDGLGDMSAERLERAELDGAGGAWLVEDSLDAECSGGELVTGSSTSMTSCAGAGPCSGDDERGADGAGEGNARTVGDDGGEEAIDKVLGT
ncbi:hypothetical protein F442_12055, partial [Phytophthora nicotianae P10297]